MNKEELINKLYKIQEESINDTSNLHEPYYFQSLAGDLLIEYIADKDIEDIYDTL